MDGVEQTNESWRILIVEDDERLAELTREYLESNGLTVTLETHGGNAVERIRKEQPDLVVLDLMLPGEDGLSICRRARPFYPGPIIMLTARTDDLDQVLGLEMGADDYIGKPVQPRVLLARIRALLRRVTENGSVAAEEGSGEEPVRLQFNNQCGIRPALAIGKQCWPSAQSGGNLHRPERDRIRWPGPFDRCPGFEDTSQDWRRSHPPEAH